MSFFGNNHFASDLNLLSQECHLPGYHFCDFILITYSIYHSATEPIRATPSSIPICPAVYMVGMHNCIYGGGGMHIWGEGGGGFINPPPVIHKKCPVLTFGEMEK